MRSIIIKSMNIPLHSSRARRSALHRARHAAAGLACLAALLGHPLAAEEPAIALKIRQHQFFPAQIEVPAGQKRQLLIENQDATAEEFESHSLHREKVIPPQSTINLFIGPLKPGRYEFIGEFNEATARGVVVAK